MANENKKKDKLVAGDDDPTAELDVATFRRDFGKTQLTTSLEADAHTSDFDSDADGRDRDASIDELTSDLRVRSETIERLQYDISQLHSKWLGLDTEIKARKEISNQLNIDLKNNAQKLERREKLLHKKDRSIKSLKTEIRERDEKFRELQESVEQIELAKQDAESGIEIHNAQERIAALAGRLASRDGETRDLIAQQERTELYADQLRRQLSELSSSSGHTMSERDSLAGSLAETEIQVEKLITALDRANKNVDELTAAAQSSDAAHAEEIRILRFELGEAEDTLTQNGHISEQLASDLIETRGLRDELERMLLQVEEKGSETIKGLRKKISKLEKKNKRLEEKLDTKSIAINCLLSELAKRSYDLDSIGEMENVIQEIDDRMSDRIDDRPPDRERVTRLLIGRIDDQELRFPIFKDKLTIGRTKQNDIQLNAQYVSRRHAVITTEGDVARIIDWGSKNGVYVNSKRVTEHFLKNGDIVTIGIAEFRYEEFKKRDT